MRVSLMLRAALIGFGSSGKTTLFQLMTSARETARAAHGKGETSVGISKVPDARLDRLTAMHNPRSACRPRLNSPISPPRAQRGGAQALVDVAAYRTPTRSSTSSARSTIPRSPPVGLGRSRARRPGDGRRADSCGPRSRGAAPRAARKRSEEKPDRGTRTRARRDHALQGRARRGQAAPHARSEGRRSEAAARIPVPVGEAALDRHQRRRVAARGRRRRGDTDRSRGEGRRPHGVSVARRHRGGRRLRRKSSSKSRSSRRPTPRRFWPISD